MTHPYLGEDWSDLLLESLADGVFTLDHDGRITSWNRAMSRISGYTAEEAVGHVCSILGFSRCMGRSCPTNLRECSIFKLGAVDGKECMLRHKKGYDVPVLKSARTIRDRKGTILGVVETVTDLTELYEARKKAESAMMQLGEISRFDNIVGKSHGMMAVFSAIRAASASEATVLLLGESGTGKELIARSIHYNSLRSAQPMMAVNCSALSELLLESELFGHVKGAYTGAIRDRMGRFEEADGGTVFLDEIGEIDPHIQVKLLRVLQEREVERVGDSRKHFIDIRVIAATNVDLSEKVRAGQFREDLYYRLKVFPITLPPLRQRKEDIPLLSRHFITGQNRKTGKNIQGIRESALRLLMDYSWPGNVRELENAMEHAFVLRQEGMIDTMDLPVEIRQQTPVLKVGPSPEAYASFTRKKSNLTPDTLLRLLTESGWNKAEAARRAGISRTAVWKKMKAWGIPLEKP